MDVSYVNVNVWMSKIRQHKVSYILITGGHLKRVLVAQLPVLFLPESLKDSHRLWENSQTFYYSIFCSIRSFLNLLFASYWYWYGLSPCRPQIFTRYPFSSFVSVLFLLLNVFCRAPCLCRSLQTVNDMCWYMIGVGWTWASLCKDSTLG